MAALLHVRATLALVLVMLVPLMASAQPKPSPTFNWPSDNSGVREVTANSKAVIPITARIRYNTTIVLPDGDDIIDAVIGDKEFWVTTNMANMFHLKPAKEGAATNLTLVTANGALYTFLLREGGGAPDLRVTVLADPDTAQPTRKFYTAAQFEARDADVRVLQQEIQQLREKANEPQPREHFPQMHMEYGKPKYEAPFYVDAIWHDGRFTYIKSGATETPVIYEMLDGKPSIVNFTFENGVFIVSKVVDEGYLTIGSKRWTFKRVPR